MVGMVLLSHFGSQWQLTYLSLLSMRTCYSIKIYCMIQVFPSQTLTYITYINFNWVAWKDLRVAGSSVILFRASSCHGYLQINRVIQGDHLQPYICSPIGGLLFQDDNMCIRRVWEYERVPECFDENAVNHVPWPHQISTQPDELGKSFLGKTELEKLFWSLWWLDIIDGKSTENLYEYSYIYKISYLRGFCSSVIFSLN